MRDGQPVVRITVDLPEDLWRRLKLHTVATDETLKDTVIRVLTAEMKKPRK